MNNLAKKSFRLNNLYKIIDKKQQLITFKMNTQQERIFEAKKHHKNIKILKGRQFGITTFYCIDKLDNALWLPNQKEVVTAHTRDKQTEIFEKVKIAYENLPETIVCDGYTLKKPKAKYDTKNELYFEDTNSSIKVSLDSRGTTVSSLHLTELAFRRDAKSMMAGTLPSVPKDSPITIETTANGTSGEGKYFYDFWKAENGFFPIFLSWFDHQEYESECPESFVFPEGYEKKRLYMSHYDIKTQNNKLYWYYIQELSLGADVMQEFPTSPDEAFLTTGSTVWDSFRLKELEEIELYYDEDTKIKDLRIYREPQSVCIGIDTAGGNERGDYTSIVGRNQDYELVFHYYGISAPEDAIRILHRVSELGYSGILVPEVNATSGGEFIQLIKNETIDNFELYRRKKGSDDLSESKLKRFGFLTTSSTRNEILDNFERIIRNESLDEFDLREIAEMKMFIVSPGGKREASIGSHDDAIMSDAICCYVIEYEGIPNIMIDKDVIRKSLL